MSRELIESLIRNRLVRGIARFIPEGKLLSYTVGNLGLSDEMTQEVSHAIVQFARSKNATVGELLVDEEIVNDVLQLLELAGKFLSPQNEVNTNQNERIEHETYHC